MRIVPQRVPFPTLPQVIQRDAFVGVIDCERSRQEPLDLADRFVRRAGAGANQSVEAFDHRALDYITRDGCQLHRSFSFPQRVLLSTQKRVEQTELRASRAILRTVSYEFFNYWPRSFKFRLRFRRVATHQIDARLKITFRQWDSRLRSNRVELAIGQGFLCGIRIAVHQAHVPAREGDEAVM